MKKLFVLAACVLCLFFAGTCLAECEHPGGKTFASGCCGDEIMLYFSNPGGFSPVDPCLCGDVAGFPYRWDANACTAIVYESECGGKPILYLIFDADGFIFSTSPAFRERDNW